ncbi:hypothetical protein L226DRAFT_576022 [Lentinus tigrinus ALCF2SS1-7]|uniref:uncharacterized protein n=1 Tax=Lentinus tigrinus ALCF2SS1-7 TaxID=1328758 RepID=UPI001165FB0B|nr:hypothetical protein L226DRAFT_576022 [Lentinus tigrinus ALCF2SS1-7]
MNRFKNNISSGTRKVVDSIVDNTVTILKTGRDAVNAAPVPGLTVAVDLLVVILEKVKAAQTNQEEARILCEWMCILSEAVIAAGNAISGGLREFKKDSLVREKIEKGLAASPELADRVDGLQRELKSIRDTAKDRRGDGEVPGKLPGQMAMEAHVKGIISMVEDSEKEAEQERIRAREADKNAEEERIINSIPRVDEAHYRSAANTMKARFQPGTRAKVFEALREWEDGQADQVRAPPRLHERGTLGASFFFTRGVQELNSPRKFFSTIASQLARSQPALRIPVVDATREHLKVAVLQQLEHEFEDLIMKPIASLSPSHSPIFIVVDALECTEEGSELVPTLLRLLLSCAARPESRIRVFLTSRPVPHYIHNVFSRAELRDHISTVSIQTFRISVDHDIRLLIKTRLHEDESSRAWCEGNPSIVPTLVAKSDGLFVYARTAVDFILGDLGDSTFLDERYSIILTVDRSKFGLAPLDSLYHTVLEGVFPPRDRFPEMKARLNRVLGYLVTLQEAGKVSPRTVELLTRMSSSESIPILNRLRSVIFFERNNPQSPFRIVHATFREFLVDSSRAGEKFYVNMELVHEQLADDCWRTIRKPSVAYNSEDYGLTNSVTLTFNSIGPSRPSHSR